MRDLPELDVQVGKATQSLNAEIGMEQRFEDLADDQQWCARARYIDAMPGDGYWYLISSRGDLISRNRTRQLTN